MRSCWDLVSAATDRNAERIQLCTQLSEWAIEKLEVFYQQPSESSWQLREIDRSALLSSLVKAMLAIDAVKPLSRLIDHALTRVDRYDLTGAHLTAIFSLESRIEKLPAVNDAISHWLGACRHELEKRTRSGPTEAYRLPTCGQTVMYLPRLRRAECVPGQSGPEARPLSTRQKTPPTPASNHRRKPMRLSPM